jgi:hypothetical protein
MFTQIRDGVLFARYRALSTPHAQLHVLLVDAQQAMRIVGEDAEVPLKFPEFLPEDLIHGAHS